MRSIFFVSSLTLFLAFSLATSVSSCYYDSEEYLYGNQNVCDTSLVRYSVEITNILEQNCYSCHQGASPLGGFSFTEYNDLRLYVDAGLFLSSVDYDGQASPMPPDSKMNDCNIEKIRVWIAEGAPNN